MAEEEGQVPSPPTCNKSSLLAQTFVSNCVMILPSLAAGKLVAQTNAPLNEMKLYHDTWPR
ncbi:hypothetical protein RND71_021807 [Anisodus tanguticus]|uniref:Uncharacterized protein n=1 Tax=Anisodus tanguticus TaxID=243964 RepID=A0AAE1RX78_9SOLA|nr:hypothetical protein RND71_021807 [Anisodus tanguticus]